MPSLILYFSFYNVHYNSISLRSQMPLNFACNMTAMEMFWSLTNTFKIKCILLNGRKM